MVRHVLVVLLFLMTSACQHVAAKVPVKTAFASGANRAQQLQYHPYTRTHEHRPLHHYPYQQGPAAVRRSSSAFFFTRNDNLVSGIAEISLGASIGVIWSEYAILTTGCGPIQFSDGLERFCYQAVIVVASFAVFTRIVTSGRSDAVSVSEDYFGYLEESTLWQVRAAEWLSLLSVVGAFVALGSQMYNGENMDGLSGIDVQMCRAVRDL